MTGMPASLAFWSAGRMALLSCASRIRTLAPFEIRVSTSVSCCSVTRLASASIYVPPPASTVDLIFGWSCAAHRGWWLFHDTPTVHAPAAAEPPPLDAALSAALGAATLGAAALALAPPPLEQAPNTMAAVASNAANLRSIIRPLLLLGYRSSDTTQPQFQRQV